MTSNFISGYRCYQQTRKSPYSHTTSTCVSFSFSLFSSPPLLDVLIVGAFLQSPGLPLLGAGVIAVVVQQEGPHLATDGWVNTTKEDGLVDSRRWANILRTKGVFSNIQRANRGGIQWGITFAVLRNCVNLYANKTCKRLCRYTPLWPDHSECILSGVLQNDAKLKLPKKKHLLFVQKRKTKKKNVTACAGLSWSQSNCCWVRR